jgi:hypothetical protein
MRHCVVIYSPGHRAGPAGNPVCSEACCADVTDICVVNYTLALDFEDITCCESFCLTLAHVPISNPASVPILTSDDPKHHANLTVHTFIEDRDNASVDAASLCAAWLLNAYTSEARLRESKGPPVCAAIQATGAVARSHLSIPRVCI